MIDSCISVEVSKFIFESFVLDSRNKHTEFWIMIKIIWFSGQFWVQTQGFSPARSVHFPPSKLEEYRSDTLIAFYKSVIQLIYITININIVTHNCIIWNQYNNNFLIRQMDEQSEGKVNWIVRVFTKTSPIPPNMILVRVMYWFWLENVFCAQWYDYDPQSM